MIIKYITKGGEPMTLAEWIKERRKALGLRQADLAAVLGITQEHLSRVETGKVRPSAALAGAAMVALKDPAANFAEQYAGADLPEGGVDALRAMELARTAVGEILALQGPDAEQIALTGDDWVSLGEDCLTASHLCAVYWRNPGRWEFSTVLPIVPGAPLPAGEGIIAVDLVRIRKGLKLDG